MKWKFALILFASLMMLMPLSVSRPASNTGTNSQHTPLIAEVTAGPNCLADGEVSDALRKLSGDYAEASEAREIFLNAAKSSPACREQVIAAIMRAMNKPDLDITDNQADYYLWRYGSELLGDLKAVEALDLLISHLDMTDGEWSASMVHYPALGGVIRMGDIAIPKLSAVLQQSFDPNMKRFAVYCLSFIGGQSAMSVLKQAQASESDPCLGRFIRASIHDLDNENYRLDGDSDKWFSAFKCSK